MEKTLEYHELLMNLDDTNKYGSYELPDGFSYVFVSNYDAHEIFNMIAHHVVPTENEFLELMK